MNQKLFKIETICFFIVIAAGSLSHFLFNISNQNTFIALFAPINESIWEHFKMLWFPYIITACFETILIKSKNFFFSKLCGGIVGIITIATIFYTYSGIIGKNFLFMDIICFILGVLAAFITSYKIIKNKNPIYEKFEIISLILIISISIMFFAFTFAPPKIELFKDSTNNAYGIYKTN